jgi:hypothetical protein
MKRVRAGARARFSCVWVVALFLASSFASRVEAAPPPSDSETPDPARDDAVVMPDLGVIRYRDPSERRSAWFGLDMTGAWVPESLGLFNRSVWMVRVVPAWALALTPWLAVGGRHGMAWYDAENIRLRLHTHQLELSGQPLFSRARMHDRLALGIETHEVKNAAVQGVDFRLGGVRDAVAHLGYGIEHELSPRWRLGWRVQLRHAWVFLDTQRQVRLSMRAAFLPRPRHLLSVELVGFAVNRNERQAGKPLPENSVHGQVAAEYLWMSRARVGVSVRARMLSSFMSGEAPVYEIREEALEGPYGELMLGLRTVW